MTLDFKVLPHQREFIKSTTNTMIVGGYGSSKSHAATLKTIFKKLQYPQYKVAYYLPHYGLVRDIAFSKFPALLSELNLKYTLNKTDKEILIDGYGSILFRSMDNAETIVGYETAYSLIDEADILPTDKMEVVYNKILGRNRSVSNACVDVVSTPEGFKWLYQQSQSGHFKVIKAKTVDNKFLPIDYIQQLQAQYPEQLLKAYLEGEFVNLQTGTIYNYFNRDKHDTNITDNGTEELIIGQDFNIGGCVSIVYIKRDGKLILIDEFESYDTQGIINNIQTKYPKRVINIYPDASGNAKKTSATKTDIQMLKDAGLRVYVNSQNPAVRDRQIIANNCFDKLKVLINTKNAPKITKAFEQHSFKENGEPEKFSGAGTVDDYTDAATYPLAFLFPIVKNGIQKLNSLSML